MRDLRRRAERRLDRDCETSVNRTTSIDLKQGETSVCRVVDLIIGFASRVRSAEGYSFALGGRPCSFNDADAAAQESTTHENPLLDSKIQ